MTGTTDVWAESRTGRRLIAVLLLILFVTFVGSVATNQFGFSTAEFISRLFRGDEAAWIIFTQVRLPRAALAVLIGGSLALSGAVLQGLFRNPLAEPGLVGVTTSASLGAVIALYSGLSAAFSVALPIGGMIGAAIAVILIKLLAGRRASSTTLILAGVAVSSMAGAATALALNLAPSPFAALEIVFWMLGSLTDRSLDHLWLSMPFILVGCALMISLGPALDSLALGEEASRSLGYDLERVRWIAVAGTALAVGAGTSVAGAIGFVGLIVPHLIRPLVSYRPSGLLLTSFLGGAALLLVADLVTRYALPGRDLKIGVVTALLGAPFFFHLLIRLRREAA